MEVGWENPERSPTGSEPPPGMRLRPEPSSYQLGLWGKANLGWTPSSHKLWDLGKPLPWPLSFLVCKTAPLLLLIPTSWGAVRIQ